MNNCCFILFFKFSSNEFFFNQIIYTTVHPLTFFLIHYNLLKSQHQQISKEMFSFLKSILIHLFRIF